MQIVLHTKLYSSNATQSLPIVWLIWLQPNKLFCPQLVTSKPASTPSTRAEGATDIQLAQG